MFVHIFLKNHVCPVKIALRREHRTLGICQSYVIIYSKLNKLTNQYFYYAHCVRNCRFSPFPPFRLEVTNDFLKTSVSDK
jgi:hypothetical protein